MSILSSTRAGARAVRVDTDYLLSQGFVRILKDNDTRLAYRDINNKNSKFITCHKMWIIDGTFYEQRWVWNDLEIDNPVKVQLLKKMFDAKLEKTRRGYENKLRIECGKSPKKPITNSHEIRKFDWADKEVVFDKANNVFKKKKNPRKNW